MNFLINNSWIATLVVYVPLVVGLVLVITNWSRVRAYVSDVRGELRKASWPWESDPKIKGFRKYKELVDSTVVVLIAMILLAGFVQLWDVLIINVIGAITGASH